MQYQKKISNLRDSIFGQMKVCSWDLKCKEFSIDFATNKQKYLYKLYENKDELFSYFPIVKSQKNYLKISMSKKLYQQKLNNPKSNILIDFFISLIAVFILSAIFSFLRLISLKKSFYFNRGVHKRYFTRF